MTPAEKLAKSKPWRREPRNKARRYGRWDCRVRAAREELRLSLRTVAEHLGYSVTALHQIEHGGDPMLSTARKIADFFGKPVEELWPKMAKA